MDAYIRKDVIKHVLSIFLIVIITVTMSCCSNIKTENKEHRLQVWRSKLGFSDNEIILAPDVKIALIDSGVDSTHPDLTNSSVTNYSVYETESLDNEHGTCMAGIISAYPGSADGAAGIAAKSQILSIDITDNESNIKMEDLIKGIRYAIDNNADIICICLGINENSEELHKIIKEAYSKNIVIIASAGNGNSLLYPAAYDEVLAAGMSDNNKVLNTYNNKKSIIYMPGDSIVTTYSSTENNSKYYSVTGTSASSAILTGISALIINQYPDIKNKEIYDYLYKLEYNKINVKEILQDIR